jgi:hypothetical protein
MALGGFHIAFLSAFVFTLIGSRRRSLKLVVRANLFLIVAVVIFLAAALLIMVLGNTGVRELVKPVVYSVFAFGIALLISSGAPDVQRLLALAAPVTIGVFLVSFVAAASYSGGEVLQYLFLAVRTGDPDILIFRVFRQIIATSGEGTLETVRANMRHDIGMGILLSAMISLTFVRSYLNQRIRFAVALTIVGSIGIALLTLSRATMFIGLLAGAYVLLGGLSTNRDLRRVFPIIMAPGIVAVLLFLSPLGNLLVARLFQTRSYDERGTALSESLRIIYSNPIFPTERGIIDLFSGNSHVVLIEMWKYGGAFGAVAALSLLLALGFALVRSQLWIQRSTKRAADGIPNLLVGSSLLMFPVVRYLTAGGGLGMTDWAAVGVAAGCFALAYPEDNRVSPAQWPRPDFI